MRAHFHFLVSAFFPPRMRAHFHTFTFKFLLFFLRGCGHSVEKTKKGLDFYFSVKSSLPAWFAGWDPTQVRITQVPQPTCYFQKQVRLGPNPGENPLNWQSHSPTPCPGFDPAHPESRGVPALGRLRQARPLGLPDQVSTSPNLIRSQLLQVILCITGLGLSSPTQ